MKKLLSALFALALCSSIALATVPYPPNCTIAPCDALNGVVMCPDTPSPIPTSVVTLTIRNQANNPIANAAVNFAFGTGPLCVCTSMVFNTTTNAQGVANMTLRAGGCINGVTDAAVFRANGVVIHSYSNAKSPDWNGSNGDCVVNLGDLIRFAPRTDLCFDFNNNNVIQLDDVIIFTSGASPAHGCAHP